MRSKISNWFCFNLDGSRTFAREVEVGVDILRFVQPTELSTLCRQFKLKASDRKLRETGCANTEGIFHIIQSIPCQDDCTNKVKSLKKITKYFINVTLSINSSNQVIRIADSMVLSYASNECPIN